MPAYNSPAHRARTAAAWTLLLAAADTTAPLPASSAIALEAGATRRTVSTMKVRLAALIAEGRLPVGVWAQDKHDRVRAPKVPRKPRAPRPSLAPRPPRVPRLSAPATPTPEQIAVILAEQAVRMATTAAEFQKQREAWAVRRAARMSAPAHERIKRVIVVPRERVASAAGSPSRASATGT